MPWSQNRQRKRKKSEKKKNTYLLAKNRIEIVLYQLYIHLTYFLLCTHTHTCMFALSKPLLFLDQQQHIHIHHFGQRIFNFNFIIDLKVSPFCVCVWLQNTCGLSEWNHVIKVYLCEVHLILMIFFSQHTQAIIFAEATFSSKGWTPFVVCSRFNTYLNNHLNSFYGICLRSETHFFSSHIYTYHFQCQLTLF